MTLRRLLNVTYTMLTQHMAKQQRDEFEDWLRTPLNEDAVDVANERAQAVLQQMFGAKPPAAPREAV